MSDTPPPRRPITLTFESPTAPEEPAPVEPLFAALPSFEHEFHRWIKQSGAIYRFDLDDTQIERLVERAAHIARARGMK